MIYLDKNAPPADIKKTLEAIKQQAVLQNAQLRLVALVPDVARKQECPGYPFSVSFLIQCFMRCLEREGHLTMPNDDPAHLLKLIVLFFKQF